MNNLTQKTKAMIIVAAVVSAVLVLTMIVLFIITNKNGNMDGQSMILITAIIVLAVASLAFAIIVRLKKSKYVAQLNKEYYAVFEVVQDAMKNSNLTKMETGEVMADVTSMLFHAQMENREVRDVVGDNVNEFVQKVKSSFGYRNTIVFTAINGVLYLIYVLALMQGVIYLVRPNLASFFTVEMGISIVPYMVMLAFLVLPMMRYYKSKQKVGWVFFIPIVLVVGYFGIHELLHYLDLNIGWIDNYLNGDFVFIKSYIMLIVYAVIAITCLVLKWLLRRRSIKKL